MIEPGDKIRFRPRPNSNPADGVVIAVDGTIVHIADESKRNRFIPVDRVLVRSVGPRGGLSWVPAVVVTPGS